MAAANMINTGGEYWEAVAREQRENVVQGLWRRYCDALHARLLDRWLGLRRFERALKTDLFDEAVGEGLFRVLRSRAGTVAGVDVSCEIAATAVRRHPALLACRADVRRLPFDTGEFDLILSNSTLDHFDSRADLVAALRELCRTLCVGGHLLLTMDNPGNPAVWLRNHLPLRWLKRTGVVPYYVGVTAGRRWLGPVLRKLGLETLESTVIMHCPRVFAVAAAARVGRSADNHRHERLLRHLQAWEALESYPTRGGTGYFVALHATRKTPAGVVDVHSRAVLARSGPEGRRSVLLQPEDPRLG